MGRGEKKMYADVCVSTERLFNLRGHGGLRISYKNIHSVSIARAEIEMGILSIRLKLMQLAVQRSVILGVF